MDKDLEAQAARKATLPVMGGHYILFNHRHRCHFAISVPISIGIFLWRKVFFLFIFYVAHGNFSITPKNIGMQAIQIYNITLVFSVTLAYCEIRF